MALNFTAASSQRLENASAPVAAAPLTIAAWFRATSATPATIASIAAVCRSGALAAFRLTLSTAGVVQATASSAGTASASSTGNIAADTWTHGAAVFVSTTSRIAYRDGGNSGTNATSKTPAAIDTVRIGCQNNAGIADLFHDGDIAEVGMWDAALDASEVAALAKGFSPLVIRPSALVFYAPLIGNSSPEVDQVGGLALTLVNTPVKAEHTRVYMPRSKKLLGLTAAAGAPPPADDLFAQSVM